jgi:hypothetical protein
MFDGVRRRTCWYVAKRNVHLHSLASTQMPSRLACLVIGIATDPRHLSCLAPVYLIEKTYTMYHYYQQPRKLHLANKTRRTPPLCPIQAPDIDIHHHLLQQIDHNRPLQGSTLKFSLIPIAANSTSKYLRTPGTATCVTSSPPAHFWPDLSSQQSFFGSSPLTL